MGDRSVLAEKLQTDFFSIYMLDLFEQLELLSEGIYS